MRSIKPLKPDSRRCVGMCNQGKYYYSFHSGIRDRVQAEPSPLVDSSIFHALQVISFLMQESCTAPLLLHSPPVVFLQLPRLAKDELINIRNKQQFPFPRHTKNAGRVHYTKTKQNKANKKNPYSYSIPKKLLMFISYPSFIKQCHSGRPFTLPPTTVSSCRAVHIWWLNTGLFCMSIQTKAFMKP